MSDPIQIFAEARLVWEKGDPEKAILLLQHPLLNEDAEAIFLTGEIHYNCQNWGAALNSFRQCLQINPENRAAQTYVGLIQNILGFFHTDQFNP